MAEYNGSIELISGITPKNGGSFPLVNAADVQLSDGQRLSDIDFENIGSGGGAANETDIINKITDPDNYPIAESTEITVDFVMESGTLGSSGEEISSTKQIRSDFVPVSTDSGKICTSDTWDDDLRVLGYDADKNFVEKKYASAGSEFSIPETWAYLRFYTGATDAQFSFVYGTPETKAEFKRVYIRDHGYYLKGENISGADSHKLVIQADGEDGNTYNITEIRAPSSNPKEATLCLTNWGNGINQMVDISSMAYDPGNPTMEIVCQARNGSPLPQFSVRFNDGEGAGRVRKFVVEPDCIPIRLTSEGLEVRRNNKYDNNAEESELVTINLADLYDTVAALGGTKSYIVEEARRVSDIVHENMTADSFVFAALADCHYGQNDDTQISISHTADALCEIKKNLSLDVIALLGDFVRGDDTDTSEGCNDMLVDIRKVFHEATRDIPSIWAVGNHDNAHYYTRDDATDRSDGDAMYSYLGSNNQETIIDSNNRQKIYGYRDFESQKIRVIYCNTADVFENTSTSSSGVSDAQLSWLTTTALDFSDKKNASDWGVIFLSHHPLDWSSSKTEPIIDIINKYINGTDDFADVANRAEIIAAFHGHTHNFRTNSISDGKIPSIGIPQVCYGRYNEYAEDVDNIEFGEFLADGVTPVYYRKAMGSAQETSFNVVVVDRKAKKIYCTNYGAGRDREYAFSGDIPAFAPTFVTPTIENGGISLSSGENVDEDTSFIRTADFIECEERATYMFVTNDFYWALMFYDENQAFLGTGWDEGDSYKFLADTSYRAPAGAKYMRLVCEDTADITNTITIHNIS